MARHHRSHSHAVRTESPKHHNRNYPPRTHKAEVMPLRASATPSRIGDESLPPFLAWPSHLFEMMMIPWRNAVPMASWMDNGRVGGTLAFPRTDSEETDTEYTYKVSMPGVSRDQVALHFQNGAIMLRIEESEDQREKGYHYRHARSVRRAFTLPVYTDARAITAKLKEGTLTITVPKTDKPVAPQSRNIDII